MGIKVNIEALEQQAISFKSNANTLNENIIAIQNALTEVTNDTEFKGATAESIKNFIGVSLNTVLISAVEAMDDLANGLQKLADEYKATVDSRSWTEEELEELIEQAKIAIDNHNAMMDKLEKNRSKNKAKLAKMEGALNSLETKKRKYEELLDHLREYATRSSDFIDDIDLNNALEGINFITSNAFTGNKEKPFKQIDGDWVFNTLDKANNRVGFVGNIIDASSHMVGGTAVGFYKYADSRLKYLEGHAKLKQKYISEVSEIITSGDIKNLKKLDKLVSKYKVPPIPVSNSEAMSEKIANYKKEMAELDLGTSSGLKQHKKLNKKVNKLSKVQKYTDNMQKVAGTIGGITGKVGGIIDALDALNKVRHGEKISKVVTVKVGSMAAGAIAGTATRAVLAFIPFVGPVASPIIGSLVDGYVSSKAEEYLEKEL